MRARSSSTPARKNALDELSQSVDAKAATGAAKYLPLIRKAKDGSWIDGFLAFRDDFEFARRATVMAAFAELRKTQDVAAQKAFGDARELFQQGKQNEGYAKYKEIVEKDYASPLTASSSVARGGK